MSAKTDWTYQGKVYQPDENFDPKKVYGFVYLITHKATGKKYIGKKFFWSKKIKTVKKKRRRILVESDWRDYWGSSKYLTEDVAEFGEEAFTREILHLCETKGHCSYMEMREQIMNDVLLSEDYYNSFVGGRIHARHVAKCADIINEQIGNDRNATSS